MTVELTLTPFERELLEDSSRPAVGLAMRVVVAAARFMGAGDLVSIESAHIDGCLYHGDGGVEFAERLVDGGGRVSVPSTLNVGALDLLHKDTVRATLDVQAMARRQMAAYVTMGCRPTWTCAPYQAGHRPSVGTHVAWGESNAVAFVNSVLGARTNRYGDFLDVCCAISGRAPRAGLHLDAERRATVVVDVRTVPPNLRSRDVFFPVLGTWLGRAVGQRVPCFVGLDDGATEDQLKALGAAAASSGAVGLFHIVGVTPEAPSVDAACQGGSAEHLRVTTRKLREVLDNLSTTRSTTVDSIALGSPHFSVDECERMLHLLRDRALILPCYVCTGRGVLTELDKMGVAPALKALGVTFVVDTCVVVTPILREYDGVLMTNSGKFAHYTKPNTGYDVVYGSLEDCIETGVSGTLQRDQSIWGADG